METLRNKQKLAAINKDKDEDHPSFNQAENSNFPRVQKIYNIQVSGEIEDRVTKKLSQELFDWDG